MICNNLILLISLLSVFVTFSHQDIVRIQSCNFTGVENHTCLTVTDCNEIARLLQTHFSLFRLWDPTKLIKEFDCNGQVVEVCCRNELPTAEECDFPMQTENGTEFGDSPWDVQLYYDDVEKSLCGGVLISKRFVLTTAYCAMGRTSDHKLKFLRLGEYDTSKEFDCEDEDERTKSCLNQILDIDFTEILIHPNYSITTRRDNDIALIRLPYEIQFTEFIRPICLDMDSTLIDEHILGTGWGRNFRGIPTETKFKFGFEQMEKSYCNHRFHIDERPDFLCTLPYNLSPENNCPPELGNAVLMKKRETLCLKGLVSQTTSCVTKSRKLAVVTLIDPHIVWIIKNLNN